MNEEQARRQKTLLARLADLQERTEKEYAKGDKWRDWEEKWEAERRRKELANERFKLEDEIRELRIEATPSHVTRAEAWLTKLYEPWYDVRDEADDLCVPESWEALDSGRTCAAARAEVAKVQTKCEDVLKFVADKERELKRGDLKVQDDD